MNLLKYLIVLTIMAKSITLPGQVLYVAPDGMGDGSSWSEAIGDIRTAIALAASGDEIWIAAGTYYPTFCQECTPSDRRVRYEIPEGIKIFGGFSGNEVERSQRDWKQNPTILSGDINRDNQLDSNSYNLIYFQNVSSQTILDGFTIANANANDTLASDDAQGKSGAGIFNEGSTLSSPTLKNLVFENNYALSYGAAIYNNGKYGGSTNPQIINCQFINNETAISGGAIFNDASQNAGTASPTIVNCYFENNASKFGAAIYNNGLDGYTQARIESCYFYNNYASSIAGAIYTFGKGFGLAEPLILNSTFIQNYGKSSGAIYSLSNEGSSTTTILNCLFYKNDALTGGAIYCNESNQGDGQIDVYNSIFWQNTATFNKTLHMSGDETPTITLHNVLVDATDCDDIATLDNTDILYCGTGNIYNQNPLFLNPSDQNFILNPSSPAVNAGNDSLAILYNLLFDQDSLPRIREGRIDLGPHENQDEIHVPTYFSVQPISQSPCLGSSTSFSVETAGTPPISIQWLKDNQAIVGANEFSLNLQNISIEDEGIYQAYAITIYQDTIWSESANLDALTLETPSVEITASTLEICEGQSIDFSVSAAQFEGDTPTYLWFKNGEQLSSEGSTVLLSMLQDRDEIYVQLISSRLCINNTPVFSDTLFISKIDTLIPQIRIETLDASICENSAATFELFSQNVGSDPIINWYLNDEQLGNNSSTLTLNAVNNGDKIYASVVNNLQCVIEQISYSDTIEMEIIQNLTPQISITSSEDSICAGASITYVAEANYAGFNPTFQWSVNRVPVGENDSIFTSTTINNEDIIACTLISSLECLDTNNIRSNDIIADVNPVLTPRVNISASTQRICEGEEVLFWTQIRHGGTNPTIRWYRNNQIINVMTDTLRLDNLSSQDTIYASLNSSYVCANNDLTFSNKINLEVDSFLNPMISISSNATQICLGEEVTFTASTSETGQEINYIWYVDGVAQTVNEDTFVASELSEDTEVWCKLVTYIGCLNYNEIVSDTITINLATQVIPQIELAFEEEIICQDSTINVIANILNGGANPQIMWYLNEELIEEGESLLITLDNLTTNDSLYASLISSSMCATSEAIESAVLTAQVKPSKTIDLEIISDQSSLCELDSLQLGFSSNANVEDISTLQWIRAEEIIYTNQTQITITDYSPNEQIQLLMISEEACIESDSIFATAPDIELVYSLFPDIEISILQDTICDDRPLQLNSVRFDQGNNPSFYWVLNGVTLSESESFVSIPNVELGDSIQVLMIVEEECSTRDSVYSDVYEVEYINCMSIGVNQNYDEKISVFPNPVSDFLNVKVENYDGEINCKLFDNLGNLIIQKHKNISDASSFLSLNIEFVPNGIYYLKIEKNNKIFFKKIIKRQGT